MRFTFGNNSLLFLQLKKCLANVWRIPCPLVPSRPTFAKAKVCGSTTPEAALVWRDMRLTRQLKNAKPVRLEGSNTRPETAPVSCAQLTLRPSSKDLSSAGTQPITYPTKYVPNLARHFAILCSRHTAHYYGNNPYIFFGTLKVFST